MRTVYAAPCTIAHFQVTRYSLAPLCHSLFRRSAPVATTQSQRSHLNRRDLISAAIEEVCCYTCASKRQTYRTCPSHLPVVAWRGCQTSGNVSALVVKATTFKNGTLSRNRQRRLLAEFDAKIASKHRLSRFASALCATLFLSRCNISFRPQQRHTHSSPAAA